MSEVLTLEINKDNLEWKSDGTTLGIISSDGSGKWKLQGLTSNAKGTIDNVRDPLSDYEVANKNYVDNSVANLEDIGNVAAPAPTNGQFLSWSAATAAWVPSEASTVDTKVTDGYVAGNILKLIMSNSSVVDIDCTSFNTDKRVSNGSIVGGNLRLVLTDGTILPDISMTGIAGTHVQAGQVITVGSNKILRLTHNLGTTLDINMNTIASPTLAALEDTNVGSPANGKILEYSSAQAKWIAGDKALDTRVSSITMTGTTLKTLLTSGSYIADLDLSSLQQHSIAKLTDIDTTGVSLGDTLVYDGSKFVASDVTPPVISVSVQGLSYVMNGLGMLNRTNPDLTFVRGQTYKFDLNVAGHPFMLKTVQGTGTSNQLSTTYTSSVTYDGTNETGTLTIVVPMDCPRLIYYNCQHHSNMSGKINVTDGTRVVSGSVTGSTMSLTDSAGDSFSINVANLSKYMDICSLQGSNLVFHYSNGSTHSVNLETVSTRSVASGSVNASNGNLTLTFSDGTTEDIDCSAFLDDTATSSGVLLNISGVPHIRLTKNDASTIDINVSALVSSMQPNAAALDAGTNVFTISGGTTPFTADFSPVLKLQKLGDTNFTESALNNGDIIKWDDASSRWVAGAPASGGSLTLVGLTDTSIGGSPVDGQVLQYSTVGNLNKWVNVTPITTLQGLTDTNISGQGTGDILKYDSNSKWVSGTLSLADLSNVNNTAPLDGMFLKWVSSASEWQPSNLGSVINLNSISDVTTSGVNNGYVLTYNSSSGVWEPQASQGGGGGSSTLSGLTDTDISSQNTGDVLSWNGTKWVSQAGGGGGESSTLGELTDVAFSNTNEAPNAFHGGALVYDDNADRWTCDFPKMLRFQPTTTGVGKTTVECQETQIVFTAKNGTGSTMAMSLSKDQATFGVPIATTGLSTALQGFKSISTGTAKILFENIDNTGALNSFGNIALYAGDGTTNAASETRVFVAKPSGTSTTGLHTADSLVAGASAIDTSAVFQCSSTSKGALLPSMSTVQRSNINSPAKGLILYNTTLDRFEANYGTAGSPSWQGLISEATNVIKIKSGTSEVKIPSADSNIDVTVNSKDIASFATTGMSITTDGAGSVSSSAMKLANSTATGHTVLTMDTGTTGAASGESRIYMRQKELTNVLIAAGKGAEGNVSGTMMANSHFYMKNYDLSGVDQGAFFRLAPSGQMLFTDKTNGDSLNAEGSMRDCALITLTSKTKGLLLPSLTNTNRDTDMTGTPVGGLTIYNETRQALNIRQASAWSEAVAIPISSLPAQTSSSSDDSKNQLICYNHTSGRYQAQAPGDSVQLNGHVLPTTNEAYDLGSAGRKIRNLFLSDNSIWVGNSSKIDVTNGRLVLKDRDLKVVPAGILAAGAANSKNAATVESEILTATGRANLTLVTLEEYQSYMNTLPGYESYTIDQTFSNTWSAITGQVCAFRVSRNSPSPSGQVMAYDTTHENEGNGWDGTNSKFVAPFAGTYVFSVIGSCPNANIAGVYALRKNGVEVAVGRGRGQQWATATITIPLLLAINDEVDVLYTSHANTNYESLGGAARDVFSGFYVNNVSESSLWTKQSDGSVAIGVNAQVPEPTAATHVSSKNYVDSKTISGGDMTGGVLTLTNAAGTAATINMSNVTNHTLTLNGANGVVVQNGTWDLSADKTMTLTMSQDLRSSASPSFVEIHTTSCSSKKKNIQSLGDGVLDRMSNVEAKSFEWKDEVGCDGTRIGLIAQDIEEEFPEAVCDGMDGVKRVNNNALIGVLWASVRELREEVRALRMERQSYLS